jgi:transketolase
MDADTIRHATTKASSGYPPSSEIRRSKRRIRRKVSIRSYAFLHGQGRSLLRRRMNNLGASGPLRVLEDEFDFRKEDVVAAAKEQLRRGM